MSIFMKTARSLFPEPVRTQVREPLKTALRRGRRALGLNNMQKVCREIQRRGVDLSTYRALEVFGLDGDRHVKDYVPLVRSLQIWEIDGSLEAALKRNLPSAVVKIVDSFEEIKRTADVFDLVVVDNFVFTLGPYCEHFELFPAIFRVLSEDSILILNVIPRLDDLTRERWPYEYDQDDRPVHLARRQAFYHTDTPGTIPLPAIAHVYRDLARENGFEVPWHFFRRRGLPYYLVLKLRAL